MGSRMVGHGILFFLHPAGWGITFPEKRLQPQKISRNYRVSIVESSQNEQDTTSALRAQGPLLRLNLEQVRYGIAFIVIMIATVTLALWLTWQPYKVTKGNTTLSSSVSSSGLKQFSVQITTRPRTSGEGVVLQIKNNGNSEIKGLVVEISNTTTNAFFKANLEKWISGQILEVGDTPDWKVGPGQLLVLQAEGYQTAQLNLK